MAWQYLMPYHFIDSNLREARGRKKGCEAGSLERVHYLVATVCYQAQMITVFQEDCIN